MSLFDIGIDVTWGEALLLERAFREDPACAYGAAIAGWAWPVGLHDVAGMLLAQGVLSFLMEKGKSVTFPMPWDQAEKAADAPTPEVVDEMTERLRRFSAFGD